jgi:outer membrane protein TolC
MKKGLAWATVLLALPVGLAAQNTKMPPLPPATGPAVAPAPAPGAPAKITLEEAIRLALQHNHALQAARTTILQNQAQETTANLRPNPTLSWDSQFFPLFNPSQFSTSYLENQAQFDVGIGYLFERGKKRQHRLQAARDATAVTKSTTTNARLSSTPASNLLRCCWRNRRCNCRNRTWTVFSRPSTSVMRATKPET